MRSAYVLGFGNPGRGDDGLGPALVQAVEDLALPGVTVEADYQLQPEHAVPMGRHDLVILADADVSGPAPFSFDRLEPRASLNFTTHGLEPQTLIALARDLHDRPVEAYLLAIRGYDFEPFSEHLSVGARRNLEEAIAFVVTLLCSEPCQVEVRGRFARPRGSATIVENEDGR